MQAMNQAAGILHRKMMRMVRSCQMPKLPTTSPMISLPGGAAGAATGAGHELPPLRWPSDCCKWFTLRCESWGEWPPLWTGDAWLTISNFSWLVEHSRKLLCQFAVRATILFYLFVLFIYKYLYRQNICSALPTEHPPPPSSDDIQLKSIESGYSWNQLSFDDAGFGFRVKKFYEIPVARIYNVMQFFSLWPQKTLHDIMTLLCQNDRNISMTAVIFSLGQINLLPIIYQMKFCLFCLYSKLSHKSSQSL